MIIPHDALSREALHNLIEEFVTREGTEYGETEIPLERKIEQVRRQLERGQAVIVFDSESQSANIVDSEALRAAGMEADFGGED